MPLVDGAAGECCLNQPCPVLAEPSDDGAAAEVTDMPSALQQLSLVRVLVGRDKVQTFLALLNQQAVACGVQMQRYEPLKKPPPNQGKSRCINNRSNANQKAKTRQDPFQALGYRKSSLPWK